MRAPRTSLQRKCRLPPGPPLSYARHWISAQVEAIAPAADIKRSALIKAMTGTATFAYAEDPGVLPKKDWVTSGLRLPMKIDSGKNQQLGQVALRLNPQSHYGVTGYPDEHEVVALCHYRFRALDSFSCGDWTPRRTSLEPVVEDVLKACGHPTPAGIAAALSCVLRLQREKGRNCKVIIYAWAGDLVRLAKSLEGVVLSSTPEFAKLYGPLIECKGVTGAVMMVLEQAMEFERTCDYVSAHLELFRSMCPKRAKALLFADAEPILMLSVATSMPWFDIGDPAKHARGATDALRPLRLARHRADAPEGSRFHSIMGLSPLDYLLVYFFSCHRRFGSVARAPRSCPFSLNSAFLRLALNVLAHLDPDEAAAELVARLSHVSKRSRAEEPKVEQPDASSEATKVSKAYIPKSARAVGGALAKTPPRNLFDLFRPRPESPLYGPLVEDPDWGDRWVAQLGTRYGMLVKRGLNDQRRNPLARALPLPEAWSEQRSISSLDHWLGALSDRVSRLDPLYSPIVGRTGKTAADMQVGGLLSALDLAAAIVEVPNPISLSRSLALSSTNFGRRPPTGLC